MSMWTPFSEDARRAMVSAQIISGEFGSGVIDAEHIFLGVARQPQSATARALAGSGIALDAITNAAKRVLPRGEKNEEMVFGPQAKLVIERAFEESRQFEQNFVVSDHLALAYLHVYNEGSALLKALGVKPGELAGAIWSELSKHAMADIRSSGESLTMEDVRKMVGTVVLDGVSEDQLWAAAAESAKNQHLFAVLLYALLIARLEKWSAEEMYANVSLLISQRFSDG